MLQELAPPVSVDARRLLQQCTITPALPPDKAASECAICLEPLGQGPAREVKMLRRCLHCFHEPCLLLWFQTKGRGVCPLCKTEQT
jgi:hypothetical protein